MPGTLNFNKLIQERKCKFCGKEFLVTIPLSQYTYRKNVHGRMEYFCSDHCKREFVKKEEARK